MHTFLGKYIFLICFEMKLDYSISSLIVHQLKIMITIYSILEQISRAQIFHPYKLTLRQEDCLALFKYHLKDDSYTNSNG